MRILAIGLGGAGGRIVDMLYRTDRRSSKVACVEALAVDVDADSLSQLTALPEGSKIYFPPIDLTTPQGAPDAAPTATVDVNEMTARVHTLSNGETDAIVICTGLGGGLVDAAPHLIAALRTTMVEPIFGLVTLPCLAEGERCSAKAADDIEILSPLLDGVIIFDNETWYKKIKSRQKSLAREDRSFATRIGLKKKPDRILSPVQRMYILLNEAIVRRISLILRAGEFKADGGLELAEVVLDAGEVLNTMRGMGFITIGYAVEQLPRHPLDFLKKWRPTGFFADEHQKKTSRVIELAKQAIYHDVSTPCDLTSAQKALILVAGPSHEISMKGYMTVRKWIDRSIAGLETRSGDYPVTSTRFVAIIIMLAGLKNIPRIQELKEIRIQYREHLSGETMPRDTIVSEGGLSAQGGVAASSGSSPQPLVLRDKMISIPGKKSSGAIGGTGDSFHPLIPTGLFTPPSIPTGSQGTSAESRKSATGSGQRRHVIVAKPDEPRQEAEPTSATDKKNPIPIKKILASRLPRPSSNKTMVSLDDRSKFKEQERKKIERELQKQRLMAMTGKDRKFDRKYGKPHGTNFPPQLPDTDTTTGTRSDELHQGSGTAHEIQTAQEMQKVVLHKKKSGTDHVFPQSSSQVGDNVRGGTPSADDPEPELASVPGGNEEAFDIWIKQASYRKREQLYDSESFKLKDTSPTVSDDALLHTDLKRPRASQTESNDMTKDIPPPELPRKNSIVVRKPKKERTEEE
jgi:cell division GTPase FtsZ